MAVEIPSNIRENTSAFLAALAAVASIMGLALTILSGAMLFFAIQGVGSAALPQIDSAIEATDNAQAVLSPAEESIKLACNGMIGVSDAMASYSNASAQMGVSLGAISAMPPFSLDPGFANSAEKIREASVFFAGASKSFNESSSGIADSGEAISAANRDLGEAKERLVEAKKSLGGAIGILGLAIFVGTLSLAALFSSVLAVSLSVLLAYYPSLFAKKS